MQGDWLSILSANGPWALVAGILLTIVVQAWKEDRKVINEMMPKLMTIINENTEAMNALTKTIQAGDERISEQNSDTAKAIRTLTDEIRRKP